MGYGPLMAICTAVIPPTATTLRFTVPAGQASGSSRTPRSDLRDARRWLSSRDCDGIASNLPLGGLLATGSLLPPIPRACNGATLSTNGVVS